MEILYEDRDIAVLVKPVGLDAQAAVPAALEAQLGGAFYLVHRLDLNVGGVTVYARTKQAAASMSRAIQDGSMVKEYVAMVHGTPPETGDWEDLLFKDSGKNKVFVVGRMRGGVKKARLEYRLLRGRDFAGAHSAAYGPKPPDSRTVFQPRLSAGRRPQVRLP